MTRRVEIVQYSADYDGSTLSALLLADGFLKAGWKTTVCFATDGPIISRFRTSGHDTFVYGHNNWLRRNSPIRFLKDIVSELRHAAGYRAVLKERKPDLVYINNATGLFGAVAAKSLNIPVIWHIRELYESVGGEMRAPQAMIPVVANIIKGLSNIQVANTRAVANNFGLTNSSRLHVVPNAVNDRYFKIAYSKEVARDKLGLRRIARDIIIGIPGTPRPMKGHKFFLSAVANYLRLNPEVHVMVTGTGSSEYLEDLLDLISARGINDRVTFLGRVSDMQVFYRACDLVVIPSRAEPFGRVIIEAFASKVPVIATRVGGIPEIIEPGRNGVLVTYGDAPELIRAIEKLLSSEGIRRDIVEAAFIDATEKYTASVYQEKLVSFAEMIVP